MPQRMERRRLVGVTNRKAPTRRWRPTRVSDFIDIASVEDLPVGRAKAMTVAGRRIALYHTPSGFHASDNSCPHRGGPLGEGDLMGEEIVCPWHLWGFDVRTGTCTGTAPVSMVMHEVRVEGSRVLVRLAPPQETAEAL